MGRLFLIMRLTLREAARKRIVLAALLCGLAFVAIFGLGFHFVCRDLANNTALTAVRRQLLMNFAVMAGLYAVNFLMVMTAVLTPVDTLSGEITSGVMQTVAARPVRRWEIVLGKWLGYWVILAGYLLLMAGGVLAVGRLRGGFAAPHIPQGLALMLLEGTVLLTLSILGGTRLSTVANGTAVLGLYGLAFVGGWMEQIGTLAGNEAARRLGTIASLFMPGEAMWQRAAWYMQNPLLTELHLTPFSPASLPSGAMVAWAAGYVVVGVAVAMRVFARREL